MRGMRAGVADFFQLWVDFVAKFKKNVNRDRMRAIFSACALIMPIFSVLIGTKNQMEKN